MKKIIVSVLFAVSIIFFCKNLWGFFCTKIKIYNVEPSELIIIEYKKNKIIRDVEFKNYSEKIEDISYKVKGFRISNLSIKSSKKFLIGDVLVKNMGFQKKNIKYSENQVFLEGISFGKVHIFDWYNFFIIFLFSFYFMYACQDYKDFFSFSKQELINILKKNFFNFNF